MAAIKVPLHRFHFLSSFFPPPFLLLSSSFHLLSFCMSSGGENHQGTWRLSRAHGGFPSGLILGRRKEGGKEKEMK